MTTTAERTDSLRQHYREKYGTPKDDEEAVVILADIFKELMGYQFVPVEVKDGIGEYYRLIQKRDLPAFEWILEAFHVTSKKNDDKKNFPYVVGMLRGWLKYGFGHIPSAEEDEVVDYFKEVTGYEITMEARGLLQNLMGRFGVLRITRMLGGLERESKDLDMSKVKVLILKELLQEKYTDR